MQELLIDAKGSIISAATPYLTFTLKGERTHNLDLQRKGDDARRKQIKQLLL